MNRRVMLPLLILPVVLAACAFGYQARGTISGTPGELRGKAFPGNTQGGGRFSLADAEGLLRCDGIMEAPDTNSTPGDCAGESGAGVIRCSDGRFLNGRWTAISCRSFQGVAEDAQGGRLEFRVERKR